MTNFESLLAALGRHQVDYIVVGGAAAIAHGSARLTQDLDIVYSRTPENLQRLVKALAEHKPYLRGAPPGILRRSRNSMPSQKKACSQPSRGSGVIPSR